MWLDADDIITEEKKEKIFKLKENLNPNIELSVCYYKFSNIKKAILHNDKASKYKTNSDAVLYNKKFFDSLK